MGGLTLAWLTGETIIVWQQVAKNNHPPIPGTLLGSSALFALLAIVAEYSPARPFATALAWGIDLAALLQVLPEGIGGPTKATTEPKRSKTKPDPGGKVTAV